MGRAKRMGRLKQTRPDNDRRRALALLAENTDGCTKPIILAHGAERLLPAGDPFWPGSLIIYGDMP